MPIHEMAATVCYELGLLALLDIGIWENLSLGLADDVSFHRHTHRTEQTILRTGIADYDKTVFPFKVVFTF